MKDLVLAELIKIRTVRSTVWTLAATVLTGAVVGVLAGLSYRNAYPDMTPAEQADYDPLLPSLYGLTLAQLALVVFGVLAVGGEFSGGTIRSSLLAVPSRGRFLAAKLLAVAVPACAVALLTAAATFGTAQVALGPHGAALAEGRTLRAIAAGWLYLTLMCLFAAGLSALLRGTTRALAVLLPLLFLGSQGLGNVPVARTVLQFLPDQAGMVAMHLWEGADDRVFTPAYGPGAALAVVLLWTSASLLAGYATLRRADVP
ncbi:ABC transporter permease subunit [Streptomyces litchfieldiae]|uniref:ABC transporter permease subunit n=1 Tax=Streptomyces litchfieldiae TaxID=3075543 RepID=A0ABU2MVW0_9ACTN|nr:ABC transporter permease subunit [Streptomyces sp. DSM 44938]MDT0345768.1 ABC transporter permease subunit [Streptomyces sp. DSM 44938]